MTKHIFKYYTLSSDFEKKHGLSWYHQAKQEAVKLSECYDVSMKVCCAVIACLSPRCVWEQNIKDADNMIKAYTSEKKITSFKVTTYGANKKKAWSILKTEDVTLLGGLKVTSFFDNILTPETSDKVTIDGHAINIYYGKVGVVQDKHFRAKWYGKIEKAYVRVSKKLNLRPLELQAIVWIAYKRIHNIKCNWRMYQTEFNF